MSLRRLLMFVACLAPGWAGAVDMEFYTYNAFEETVAAFQRVSLVLQSPSFTVFVLVFAVAGILVGGLVVGARGMQGRTVNPIAYLIPVVVGVALFRAFVWPTGTLFIYDPVRNATQAVGDVPDAVVLMAGTLNKIERGVVEIIETASADPDAERSGALRYSLILNALNARGTNISLERNLMNYYLDCGLPSMSLGFNGASQQEAERNTADLYDTFARFAHPSFSTIAYTGAGDTNVVMTCAAMWANVLNPALSGAGALSDVRDMICAKTGFDMTVAAQQARCDGELQSLGTLYGLSPSSPMPFIRSTQMAIAMTNAMRSGDISVETGALVNRQVMAEGMGVAEALDRWVPKVRGFMTAAVLGMVPLALLFVVTPLMGKALQLLAGLFLWLTLWGVADAISVSMAADAAADSFNQMQTFGFSHLSFMLSPEGAIQSLGVFGKARGMALMMATVLSYALFQFGGYAFTNMANSWQNDIQQMGESAGRTAMMPEERAALMQRLSTSPATEATLNQYGFAAVAAGATMGPAGQAREASRAGSYVSSGLNGPLGMGLAPGSGAGGPEMGAPPSGSAHGAAELGGAWSGATSGGGSSSGPSRPGGSLFDNYIDPQTDIRAGRNIGEIESREEVAQRHGSNVLDVTRESTRFGDVQGTESTLAEKSTLGDLGHDAASSGTQMGRVSGGRTSAQSEIIGQIAKNEGVDSESSSAAQQFGRQERGEMIGAVRGAHTDQYITTSQQSTIRRVAEGEQMERDASAGRIGRADAIGADISARGMNLALSEFGRDAQVKGNALDRMSSAARGQEVFDSEDAGDFTRGVAHVDVAGTQARVEMAHTMGRLLGIDTSTDEGMKRFSLSHEGANQTVTVAADPSMKERVIDAFHLDSDAASALRNHQGGMKLSASVDESGNVAWVAVTAGGQTTLVDSTDIERGLTERANYEYTVTGGRALLNNAGRLEGELDRVYGEGLAEGKFKDTEMNAVKRGVAQYMSESGQTLTASELENVIYSFGAQTYASWGTPEALKTVTGLSGGASTHAGIDKSDSDSRQTAQDLSIVFAGDAIEQSRLQAIAAFQHSHDNRLPMDAEERREVLEDMAGRIRSTMSDFSKAASEETRSAEDGHDVYDRPEPPPAPPPMSDPDYANFRAPISRR
jgi:hypothetical protein